MWGPLPESAVADFLLDFNRVHDGEFTVSYVYKSPEQLEQDYVQALARNQGPDLLILPDTFIYRYADTLFTVPFESYPLRDFQDNFADGAKVFLTSEGTVALPVVVDPLVMYYNRDILAGAGLTRPPLTWSEMVADLPKVNSIADRQTINRTLVALGVFSNIRNAEAILTTLFFQAGNPLVIQGTSGKKVTLSDSFGFSQVPAVAAVDFFNQFSSPVKSVYSWNQSLPLDRQMFAAGRLATYFGYASEYANLQATNPNLNFDVAILPQRGVSETDRQVTGARFYGLGIVRSSRNFNTAFQTAFLLTAPAESQVLASLFNLPPARGGLLGASHPNPFQAVFYRSALISQSWWNPNPGRVSVLMQNLVDSVATGQKQTNVAVNQANQELQSLFTK